MVLPLLVAGGYGAAALASAAGAARLRRQLAKMAAGPRGDPLSADVPLRSTEREVARLGRTLVISDELQVRERGDTLHTLFDYVLLSSERIVLHNAHSTDEEFHEADEEMSVESELAAFVFTHGYKIELTVSTAWGQEDQDFSLTLSFESLQERDEFLKAFLSAREQWNNGNSVASAALVATSLLDRGEDASTPVKAGSVLRVVDAAKVRAGPALDSEQVGMLLAGERLVALEVVTLSWNSTVEFQPESSGEDEHEKGPMGSEDEDEDEAGDTRALGDNGKASTARSAAVVHTRHRVRFHRGWASIRASDGDLLLAPDVHLEPEPEPEPSTMSLTGLVTGAASEAIKMLSQSETASANSAPLNAERHRSPVPLARQVSLPRLSVQSSLLRMDVPPEQTALLELQMALPPLLQAFDWSLKYRLSQDGASLGTLLRQSGMSTPLLVIAKVEVVGGGSYLLGGLASRTLAEKIPGTNEVSASGKWKGTGQSFVFGMPLPADDGSSSGDGRLHTWGWTRQSNCFQLAGSKEGLALGGGGDFGYGIWFDPQLQVCTSSSCATYGNKSSLLHSSAFADDPQNPAQMHPPHPDAVTGAVVEMEVWAFA